MLKVILFDIDNTLLSFDDYVRETMKTGFRKFGLPDYEEEMFPVFTKINNSLWEAIERQELTFDELQLIRWNRIFEALQMKADGIAFEAYFKNCLYESAIPVPGALELLSALKDKYQLFTASNGPYEQQIHRMQISGMDSFFSAHFISEDIGASKPSEEFFQECFRRINEITGTAIEKEEMLIIGDSLSSDIAGGKKAGIRTCFYNPKGKEIPDVLQPDYTVQTLAEIRELL